MPHSTRNKDFDWRRFFLLKETWVILISTLLTVALRVCFSIWDYGGPWLQVWTTAVALFCVPHIPKLRRDLRNFARVPIVIIAPLIILGSLVFAGQVLFPFLILGGLIWGGIILLSKDRKIWGPIVLALGMPTFAWGGYVMYQNLFGFAPQIIRADVNQVRGILLKPLFPEHCRLAEPVQITDSRAIATVINELRNSWTYGGNRPHRLWEMALGLDYGDRIAWCIVESTVDQGTKIRIDVKTSANAYVPLTEMRRDELGPLLEDLIAGHWHCGRYQRPQPNKRFSRPHFRNWLWGSGG